MKDSDRFKLYFGPYDTPRFRYGQRVWCHYRGWVKIVGLTDGKIQWPIRRPIKSNPGRDSMVIYHGLKRAIEKESNQGVAHWWGVSRGTVRRWRRALAVPRKTPGTVRTLDVTLKAESRRSKIAASRVGKPRPKHVMEAVRKANLGRPLSSETRKKMSEAHRKRGTRPPWLNPAWSQREDKLLRDRLPTAEVVKRTGRTATAVCLRRLKLKLPPTGHVTYQGKTQSIPAWAREVGMTPEALRLRLKQLPVSKALTLPKQPRVRLS